MPLPPANIHNVPMDYFLRGVDAAKPQGAPPAPQGGQPPQAGAQAPQPQGAGKLVAQLDVLLLKAARESTTSLTASKVKKTLRKLVDDGALDRNSLDVLAKAADTASKTFKALDKFNGRQLAAAFDAEGNFDGTSTKAGKAVAAAVKAQQELSDLLAEVARGLARLERHDQGMRAVNPQYKGVDTALFNAVNDFRAHCDRRATEIVELASQMREFSLHLASHGRNADPNVVAILKAKVSELLPHQALAMHGTPDALATVNRDVTARLRPVAEKIDAFRRNPTASITHPEYRTLKADIAAMKAALQDIRQNGVAVEGGRMVVPRDIVKALEKEVAKAEELFKTARAQVVRKVLADCISTARDLFCTDPVLERNACNVNAKVDQALRRRDEMLGIMDAIVLALVREPKKTAKIDALLAQLSQKATDMVNAANGAVHGRDPVASAVRPLISRLGDAASVVMDFLHAVARHRSEDRFFTGAEAMAVFEGKISVSSVVEARTHGLQDSDVNPANEDANIVSERLLGAGAAGRVHELTRTDGTKVVFKGEAESRTGLAGLAAGGANSYGMEQQTVNLNFAAKKAAEALGMGGLIVDYSAGAHKGVFGFYMEKAKGMTACEFAKKRASSSDETGMSAREIKNLSPGQRLQLKADLMRELNHLRWVDLLTGQTDRHDDNYFIHVDRTTRKVTVKGIDNDAGYSQYRTGAVTYSFDPDRTETFKELLLATAGKIDSRNAEALRDRMLQDPGITLGEGGTMTIDASKVADKAVIGALVTLTGDQCVALPDKIDRETYDAFMALKEGPRRQAYLESIRPRLSEESYHAAVRRLDDTIALAERLKDEGKLVEDKDGVNGWLDQDEVPRQTGKISVQKLNGREKRLGGEIAQDVNQRTCPSYFARDGLDKLFA